MSDGAFRDDQEAALARADALEDELAREKRENEALREANEALVREAKAEHVRADKAEGRAPKAEPKRVRTEQRWREWLALVLIGGTAIVVVGLAVYTCRKDASKVTAREQRKAAEKVWQATIDAPWCVRQGLLRFSFQKYSAETADPRLPNAPSVEFDQAVTKTCREKLKRLAGTDAFAPIADGLAKWETTLAAYAAAQADIADYYKHQDWKDDNYAAGPAKWRAILDAGARTQIAADGVRDRMVAIVHAELQRYESAWDDHDTTWWYLETGRLLQLAADEYRFGDKAKVAADMAAFDAQVKAAPLEVRRFVRSRVTPIEGVGGYDNALLQHIDPPLR